MIKLLTRSQMAAAESAAVASGSSEEHMMELAGASLARKAIEVAGKAYGARVVVVCGKGNNAGDGFVAARHLRRMGASPVVVTLVSAPELGDLPRCKLDELGPIRVVGRSQLPKELDRADVVLDAIVGTGLKGPLQGDLGKAADDLCACGTPTVSADVPSGIDAESGTVAGSAVRAVATVTMGAMKPGLLLHPGAELAGEVSVADIGIGHFFPNGSHGPDMLAEASDVSGVLPKRSQTAHKRSVGKVLVVAGSQGMSGAAALTAMGAYRSGAGLVRIAVPASISAQVAAMVTEALTIGVPETSSGSIESGALAQVSDIASSMDAVAIGPGLGDDPETAEFVRKLLEVLDKPVVLDASGLNGFEGDISAISGISTSILLTPHAGELGRLMSSTPEEIGKAPLSFAKEASERSGAVVLLKGQPTIVASGGMAVFVNSGGPVLATAGTGDVLTGAAAAMATRCSIFDAGWAAAWIHGRAGHVAAEGRSATGVIARDVAEAIPAVVGSLV